MNDLGSLPIAETFHSIQGEGQWVGTPMHFIRLAGCPVGRPPSSLKTNNPGGGDFPVLNSGQPAMVCASWDGRRFYCDTDYSKKEEIAPDLLIADTWEKHICLTGGEPLIHQKRLRRLFDLAHEANIVVHIESSGTIPLMLNGYRRFWLTIAPKISCMENMILEADEVKFLVDEHFDPNSLTPAMRNHPNVFLCPINDVSAVDQPNVQRCLHWLKSFPNWRLSFQAHKFLNLR